METEEKIKNNNKLIWIGVVTFIVIAVLVLIFYKPNVELSIGNSPVLGDANAPVTIYEFSDFSCPYCEATEGTNSQVISALQSRNPGWEAPVPLIKEKYVKTGKAKIIFKYFPGHGAAGAAHAVAFGLKEQNNDLFWKFAEKAFANQENLNNINKMKEWAQELGADMNKLDAYLNSKDYEIQMDEDLAIGKANGVEGTPTFFINGEVISGAQPFSVFKDIMDKELA